MTTRASGEGLPESVRGMLGVEMYVERGVIQVDHTTVRNACAAVENGNTLYWDDELALEVAGGPIAPQTMVSVWTRPYNWSPSSDVTPLPLRVHFDLKRELDYPEAIMSSDELVFYEPVFVGDTISSSQVLLSVSEVKLTRLGMGRFWDIEVRYRNQKDDLCCREVIAGFGYRKADA